MKKGLWGFLVMLSMSFVASAADFTLCKSQYALCTTAKCTPTGNKNIVACKCDVKNGYSVGKKPCQGVKEIAQGQLIFSRYYPIKSYMVCSNNRPWAWCLDKPCTIDKNNPSNATCMCTAVKNLGNYIIVANSYSPNVCTTGIISSATVKDATQITDFLKTQKQLKPYPIKVISK